MRVITAPSLLQVTVVAGPPVEVQVRVVERTSKVKLVTVGEPAENGRKVGEGDYSKTLVFMGMSFPRPHQWRI